MEADQLGRLRDILQAAQLIAAYVKDVAETDFRVSTEKQDAVIRRIEIIGEVTVHLSETTRQAIPTLPFRKMRGMRNIVGARLRQRGPEGCVGSGDDACAGSVPRAERVLRRLR